MMKAFAYGMRLRGASPGTLPTENLERVVGAIKIGGKKYCNVIYYKEPLSQTQIKKYGFDFLGEVILGG